MKVLKWFMLTVLLSLTGITYEIGGIFAVIGIYVSGYVIYQLIEQDYNWIPIGEIALALAAFQWIVSPLISYTIPGSMFLMSQDCGDYMMYTVPMYICFAVGYYSNRKYFLFTIEQMQEKCMKADRLSTIFIAIGIVSISAPVNIAVLNQFLKFASQLMYVGFLMKMIATPQKSTLYIICALTLTLFLSIIGGGMFHELVTWGIIMFLIWFKIKKISLTKKILILFLGLLCVNTMQTVKYAFRQQVWYGRGSGNSVSLFVKLMIDGIGETEAIGTEGFDNNSRYNQGWIISRIYSHVPNSRDYFYGRTYKDAVVSSLLPRFLAPEKKGSGEQVRSDFMEMTGLYINKNTSMGLSILGESYGNFGLFGGSLFMFLWGLMIAKIMALVNIWSKQYSFLWVLLLPIICFMLVEAEISMITVLNWTMKGLIFALIVIFFSKRHMPSIAK